MPARVFGMISTEKSLDYTIPALRSFIAQTELQSDDEFHLIDNDKSPLRRLMGAEFPWVRLMEHDKPKGFAENMNIILRRADEKKADAFLLNNDMIFGPNWLPPLIIDEPAVTASVCNMQYNHQTAGLKLVLKMRLQDYVGHEADFLAIVQHHQRTVRGYQPAHSIPFYCVRIPPSVYSTVGFLDELYSKAGFEDSDYAVRCWERAIPLYYAKQSFVLHFYGKSSWAADSGPPEIDPNPKIGRRGEMLFRKRWGNEMAEMFAVQSPAGQELLARYVEHFQKQCYITLARKAREYRNTVPDPDEP